MERYSVCGISYGGFVVYRMAETFTDEIEKVVIISSGICATEEQREEMVRREGRDVVEILMPERAEDLRALVHRSMYRPPSWMPAFLLQDFIDVSFFVFYIFIFWLRVCLAHKSGRRTPSSTTSIEIDKRIPHP